MKTNKFLPVSLWLKKLKLLKLPILVLATLIFGFFSGNYYSTQKQNTLPTHGTVTRIIDADTLELDNQYSVRYYGVNCPEKGQKFSQEAIDLATKLALNQKVTLDFQPNYTKDKWERILAYVFIGDTHLNEQLISQGFCTVTIYDKRAKLIYQDQLLQVQDQAKLDKIGRWK